MSGTDPAVLERALKRERKRREAAEQLLEDKSRDLYHSYEALQESHEKLAEALKEVKSQQIQLVQSEKLASLGTMAAGVAHEINNPLSFVLSNVNSLSHATSVVSDYHRLVQGVISACAKNGQAASLEASITSLETFIAESDLDFVVEDCGELIDETKNGINRVKEIVAGLRDFARADSLEVEEVNIQECLENTLKLAHNQIKFNLAVTRDFENLPLIKGYPGKLSQVFLNLIVNASQAMSTPGNLTIASRLNGDVIVLTFEDDGCGMPAETMENIFNPFFTTKPVGKGTGLGLSISHGIVEEHNGKISVTSEPDKGTCFTIALPVALDVKLAA